MLYYINLDGKHLINLKACLVVRFKGQQIRMSLSTEQKKYGHQKRAPEKTTCCKPSVILLGRRYHKGYPHRSNNEWCVIMSLFQKIYYCCKASKQEAALCAILKASDIFIQCMPYKQLNMASKVMSSLLSTRTMYAVLLTEICQREYPDATENIVCSTAKCDYIFCRQMTTCRSCIIKKKYKFPWCTNYFLPFSSLF